MATENGALSNSTTYNANLNFFASAGALRSNNRLDALPELFQAAFQENAPLALANALHLRDPRHGSGEREAFRMCLEWLSYNNVSGFLLLAAHTANFGRWDDILMFIAHPNIDIVHGLHFLVDEQLTADIASETPSLLAKWMPSENASSMVTRVLARKWIEELRMSSRIYRIILSRLRSKLHIVETNLSNKSYSDIVYAHVPSQAMLHYRNAFRKHDTERFVNYLEQVRAGKTTIKASTLAPYQIIERLSTVGSQELWDALPDYLNGEDALVVCDTSGSMHGDPMMVALSLGLYAADRNSGALKNTVMTFSQRPELIRLERTGLSARYGELLVKSRAGYNTNIQAVFDVLLELLVQEHPATAVDKIFIISDMQFDQAAGYQRPQFYQGTFTPNKRTNFQEIREKYERAGFKMPKLIFWNVRAVPGDFPVTMNDDGVLMASGLSTTIFQDVMQHSASNPVQHMLATLRPYIDMVGEY